MIITLFLDALYALLWLVTSPLRLLPDVTVESGFSTAIAEVIHRLSTVSPFFPLTTLLDVIYTILAVEVVIFAYKLLMWLIRRFPTQS